MIKNKKVLGIIQIRSGSKGIIDKNITDICGYPLVSYTIYAAKNSKYIDELIISTDSKKYCEVVNKFGAKTPFLRSNESASDLITSVDSLLEYYIKYEKIVGVEYDFIVELPAVSPLRNSQHIDQAIEKLYETKSDSVISVVNTGEKHPVRLKNIDGDIINDFCNEFPEPEKMSRRQDLSECYIRNGAIYSMTRDCLINQKSRSGKISRPYVMEEKYSFNIDTKLDLKLVKLLIADGLCDNFPGRLEKISTPIFYGNQNSENYILVTVDLSYIKNLEDYFSHIDYKIIYQPKISYYQVLDVFKKYNIIYYMCSPVANFIIDDNLISSSKNFKKILTPSTGSTHINISDNDKLYSIRDSKFIHSIYGSSEFSFLLMFQYFKQFKNSIDTINIGYWRENENILRGRELNNLKCGIIGFGRIGRNLAKYCSAFGMDVKYYDPYVINNTCSRVSSLEKVMTDVDVIFISVNLNQETKNLISKNLLLKLDLSETIIINTSRGEIVDEECVLELLENLDLKFYIADVIQDEKRYFDNILFKQRQNKNIFLSPHIAGLTVDSERKAFELCLKQI